MQRIIYIILFFFLYVLQTYSSLSICDEGEGINCSGGNSYNSLEGIHSFSGNYIENNLGYIGNNYTFNNITVNNNFNIGFIGSYFDNEKLGIINYGIPLGFFASYIDVIVVNNRSGGHSSSNIKKEYLILHNQKIEVLPSYKEYLTWILKVLNNKEGEHLGANKKEYNQLIDNLVEYVFLDISIKNKLIGLGEHTRIKEYIIHSSFEQYLNKLFKDCKNLNNAYKKLKNKRDFKYILN